MKKILSAIILFCCLSAVYAEDTVSVRIGNSIFRAEVADTESKRRRGLMFRETLEPDRGMLFIHPEERLYSYWMKNCRINLDIIFIDEQRVIVHIAENVPPCYLSPCPTYSTPVPAKYVLELKGGTAALRGIKTGDRLIFKGRVKNLSIQ